MAEHAWEQYLAWTSCRSQWRGAQAAGIQARHQYPTDSIEHQEALEPSAVVSQLSDSIESEINDLLADGVVTASKIVRSIFLAGNELLWVEELAVCASPHLVNNSWLEIQEDGAGHVLSGTSLTEKGVESIVTSAHGLIRGHLQTASRQLSGLQLERRYNALSPTIINTRNLADISFIPVKALRVQF